MSRILLKQTENPGRLATRLPGGKTIGVFRANGENFTLKVDGYEGEPDWICVRGEGFPIRSLWEIMGVHAKEILEFKHLESLCANIFALHRHRKNPGEFRRVGGMFIPDNALEILHSTPFDQSHNDNLLNL